MYSNQLPTKLSLSVYEQRRLLLDSDILRDVIVVLRCNVYYWGAVHVFKAGSQKYIGKIYDSVI